MTSAEIVALFRATVADEAEPYLWSDVEAYSYLDDAQKTFCRKTGGLGDGSSAITQLAYTTDTDWIVLSPLILKIRGAMDRVTGRPVAILNMEDIRAEGLRFDGRQGRVQALVIGIEPGRARAYPFPDAEGDIDLIVDRLPLKTITGDQKMEVAEQHHQALIKWMMHRAYGKQDAETMNNKKSGQYGFEFDEYCFDAKAEKDRAMHKTRTVRYGGI